MPAVLTGQVSTSTNAGGRKDRDKTITPQACGAIPKDLPETARAG
jgi:hypothetical protein